MAFRPAPNLIEGVIDNSVPGHVRGWISFCRKEKTPLHCELDLDGDFQDDIRGRILHIWNNQPSDEALLDHFSPSQVGKTGSITLEYVQAHAYIEWYSERNGRVVLEIPLTQCEVLGADIDLAKLPPRKSHPELFQSYLRQLAVALRKQTKNPNASVLGVGSEGIQTPDEPERN
jgi:hypothetical protein